MGKYGKVTINILITLIMISLSLTIPIIFKYDIFRSNVFLLIMIFSIIVFCILAVILKVKVKEMKFKGFWNIFVLNILIFLVSMLSYSIYFTSFNFFDKDMKLLADNDSIVKINNNYELNVMMNKKLNEIVAELNSSEAVEEYDIFEITKTITANPYRAIQIFEEDDNYYIYKENGIFIEEVIDYFNKYINNQTAMQGMGYYISVLLLLLIIYYFNEYIFIADDYVEFRIISKRNIYLVAFFIYAISFIDFNSSGLFTIILQRLNDVSINKEDIDGVIQLLSAFKEAFLTFIIFDTVIECTLSLSDKKRSEKEKFELNNEIDMLKEKFSVMQVNYQNQLSINSKSLSGKKKSNRKNK